MKNVPSLIRAKIYGSVLGKIIGVRAGNPLEFLKEGDHVLTSCELQRKYPHIKTYIDKYRNVYADDDTNGFVFFAKIFDNINTLSEVTPEAAAKIILNYAAENRGFFWWYESTESKAFYNLVNGVSPRISGDYDIIGRSADTVGGQIFYDAVGIILGGKPEEAARCARIIAGVMHNGEGAIGGSFISACISAAFNENNVENIVNTALSLIPSDSKYAEMVRNIMDFYHRVPNEWTACQHYIDKNYTGYNAWDFGAHIVMALLYGNGNFSYSMEICLKSGGDTDCNCGNLGAILGAMIGHKKISYKNWIKPMNDILYCSSAVPYENEVSITQLTAYMIKLFAKFNGYSIPNYIKTASELNKFSFAFRYSYQNFHVLMWRNDKQMDDWVNDNNMFVSDENVGAPSGSPYTLKIWADSVRKNDCIKIFRWFNIGNFDNTKYEPTSCTKIYPGQTIRVNVMTRYNTARMKARLSVYSQTEGKDRPCHEYVYLEQGKWNKLEFTIPSAGMYSFYDCVNIELIMSKDSYYSNGYDGIDLYIDTLKITGKPCYRVNPAYTGNITDNSGYYTIMKNFNVCYGEAYSGGYYKSSYMQFHSGYPNSRLEQDHWQEIAYNKNFALAFTGSYVDNCDIFCDMSVLPDGESYQDYGNNASLIVFGAIGAADYYAAGFYNGNIVILKSDAVGEFTVLASKRFEYDYTSRYRFKVSLSNGFIVFYVNYISPNNNTYELKTITYNTGKSGLKGCIGFAALGNGITVYEYGII
ncbi:MAG: ADP-ribosylglycohydrolase family protein [Ruminococcus sp.]|nr:ADP-ribosylglycohydrolase family protein [Ruminococcus sp.]